MTRGIEETLGLPHLEDIIKNDTAEPIPQTENEEVPLEEISAEEYDAMALVAEQTTELQQVDGNAIDHSKATETVYTETLQHSRDLMDLGYNTDPRSMRGIFEQAVNMYRVALDAKNSKRDRQLQAMKLALEKRKLEIQQNNQKNDNASLTTDAVIIEDRNDLIERLRREMGSESNKKKPK